MLPEPGALQRLYRTCCVVVKDDIGLIGKPGVKVVDEGIQRLRHVLVAQVPRRDPTGEDRAIAPLGVPHEPRVLLGEEKVVGGQVVIPSRILCGRAAQLDELSTTPFARRREPMARRIVVRLRVLAEVLEAGYGIAEVATSPFEIWNEPNMRGFWRGTREQYLRLYATAACAWKEVHPDIPVGGPATAQNAWITEFLYFSERRDVPVDFASAWKSRHGCGRDHHEPGLSSAFSFSSAYSSTSRPLVDRG